MPDFVLRERVSLPQQVTRDTPSTRPTGILIINADDWGRDYQTTERTKECFLHGSISSVSAMAFMEDSERAAAIACEEGIDVGLHLNFTAPFSGPEICTVLAQHQERVAQYLGAHRFAQLLFHPGLVQSFEYVAAAQLEEFFRLYGVLPGRVDGHHHMHLCANVLLQRLLPQGVVVRRNFSFQRNEKGLFNRSYRRLVDAVLARSHRLADYFFSLPPLDIDRLSRIAKLSHNATVEIETHPINAEEYAFLMNGELLRTFGDSVSIATAYKI